MKAQAKLERAELEDYVPKKTEVTRIPKTPVDKPDNRQKPPKPDINRPQPKQIWPVAGSSYRLSV